MSDLPQKSQFLIYQAENGAIKIDVRFEEETVWLSQPLMAELFQTTQQNISLHLQNVYEKSEQQPEATHKEFLSVRREGSREVQCRVTFANRFDDFERTIHHLPKPKPTLRWKKGGQQ